MTTDATRLRQAAARYGPSVDAIARRYVNPITGKPLSGAALLEKTLQGESSALTNPNARNDVSSAGARGWAQFMPGSRAVAIQKYGVDPWKSPEDAVHGMSLHLRGLINGQSGLEGYNPGSPTYRDYILGQKVGPSRVTGGPGRDTTSSSGGTTTSSGGATGGLAQQLTTSTADTVTTIPATINPSPLTPPAFAAAPTLPEAYQAPTTGGVTPAQTITTPGTEATDTLGGDVAAPATQDAAQTLGLALKSGLGAAETVQVLTNRATALDNKQFAYKWGGGHGGRVDIKNPVPVDCSGAVSAVLGIDPRVSGQFEGWGSAGKSPSGKGVTIYANAEHVLMEINGHFFGTSKTNPKGGAGWIPRSALSKDYLSGFTVRHAANLES